MFKLFNKEKSYPAIIRMKNGRVIGVYMTEEMAEENKHEFRYFITDYDEKDFGINYFEFIE